MAKYPLVCVEWDDHKGDHSWMHEDDVDNEPLHCVSVGWFFFKNKKTLTLIGAMCDINDTIGTTQTILCSCITKLTVLQKADR
jgi:hypothetical protein